MSRRFPQEIRVGHLLGAEVVADDRKVLGLVRQVVQTPEGKVQLIVSYRRWFELSSKLVCVPIERVGSLGPQVGSIDMEETEYRAASPWVQRDEQPLPPDRVIRIALAKR